MNVQPITRREKLTFSNEQGTKLSGLLEQPATDTKAFAVLSHCFTCSKDIPAATHISRTLAARGFGVLRFDFTGLGNSEGNFADTTFSTHIRDIIQAANYLRENFAAPALLIGHSLSGVAVLSAAREIPEVAGVITIAAPGDTESIRGLLEDGVPDTDGEIHGMTALARQRLKDNRYFFADISASKIKEGIQAMGKALLVLHSPRDKVVGLQHARNIFEAARHPKSFISLDKADHLLTQREDSQYAGEIIATWAGRYIQPMNTTELPISEEPEIGEVVVTERDGRFSQEIRTNRHRLLADEPIDYGGADIGPSPYELLLAGLGACTSMTLRMYANHKKLPIERISVRLDHEKVNAKDCPNCKTQEGKVDRITREIHITGDLTPEQHRRIVAIANRCPVHKTIHGEIDDQAWVISD
ncbi:MAG: alpha/beta fold hydrolase [Gammaproteobacteria bacterium]|nr:alpha/beta fold hydrolase [Gammaproteobacteria bacterium]NNJ85266.1 alpha/beta fold hydrolase [Gammaproteobacteria bacterium]